MTGTSWNWPKKEEIYGDIDVRFDGTYVRGGFGAVYFGSHLDYKKEVHGRTVPMPVAVKFWSPSERNQNSRSDLFALEQARVIEIRHENVIEVLRVKERTEGRPRLIVMPRLDLSVGELQKAFHGQRLPLETTVKILLDCLEGLKHLQQQKPRLVHNDIKPGNLFIKFRDQEPPLTENLVPSNDPNVRALQVERDSAEIRSAILKRPFSAVIGDLGIAQREGVEAYSLGRDRYKHPNQYSTQKQKADPGYDTRALLKVFDELLEIADDDGQAEKRDLLKRLANRWTAENAQLPPIAAEITDQVRAIYGRIGEAGADLERQYIAPPEECEAATGDMEEYVRAITDELVHFRERTRQEASRAARQSVMRIMGSLTERFGGTSAWLFLKKNDRPRQNEPWVEGDCKIQMAFCHNTGFDSLEVDLEGTKDSIVGHVALTRRPYLCNDVRGETRNGQKDRHYQDSVESTMSEIAVPILVDTGDGQERVIGVLNLESNRLAAFLEVHKGELMAAATELAPHILVLSDLRLNKAGFGWHPAVNGWTPERLLADFCNAVSFTDQADRIGDPNVVLETNPLPRPSCTIWYFDPEAPDDEKLFVRATSRFDHEYIADRRLPRDSFTGEVARTPRGSVGFGSPKKEAIQRFRRGRKADKMNMVYVLASPINGPARKDVHDDLLGSLNLYFFGEELAKKEIRGDAIIRLANDYHGLKKLVAELAHQVGELVTRCQNLRQLVAAAYLRFRMQEQALAGVDEFDIARTVISECLDADACSIFGRDDRTLICVATTGLVGKDGTSAKVGSAVYNLHAPDDKGITAWLGEERKNVSEQYRSIRRASVTRLRNTPIPPPVNKFRETFSLNETEHRPFLGISVDDLRFHFTDEDTRSAEGGTISSIPLGVIRLVRRYRSKPFVRTDEALLRRLSSVLVGAFRRWRAVRRDAPLQEMRLGKRYHLLPSALGGSPTAQQLNAVDRLAAAFPAGACWNRSQVDAVLLDLANLFRNPVPKEGRYGSFIVNFRLLEHMSDKDGLNTYATHSLWSTDLPDEQMIDRHREAGDSIGMRTIKLRKPIIFDKENCSAFVPILAESEHVKTGICMPVRSVSSEGVFWGVLSVDFDNGTLNSRGDEHLQIVALAAKKLDFIGRDNRLVDDVDDTFETWEHACEHFFLYVLPKHGVQCGNFFQDGEGVMKHSQEDRDEPKRQFVRNDPSIQSGAKTGGSEIRLWYGQSQEQRKELAENTAYCRDQLFQSDLSIKSNADTGGFEIPLWYGPFETGVTLKGVLDPQWREKCKDDESMKIKLAELSHLCSRFVSSNVGTGVQPFFHLFFTSEEAEGGMIRWTPNVSLGWVSAADLRSGGDLVEGLIADVVSGEPADRRMEILQEFIAEQLGNEPWQIIGRILIKAIDEHPSQQLAFPDFVELAERSNLNPGDFHITAELLCNHSGFGLERVFLEEDGRSTKLIESREIAARLKQHADDGGDPSSFPDWARKTVVVWRARGSGDSQ